MIWFDFFAQQSKEKNIGKKDNLIESRESQNLCGFIYSLFNTFAQILFKKRELY